jgi:hypothetical protein
MITGSNGFFVANTSNVAGVRVERVDGVVVEVVGMTFGNVGTDEESVEFEPPPPLKKRSLAMKTTTRNPATDPRTIRRRRSP